MNSKKQKPKYQNLWLGQFIKYGWVSLLWDHKAIILKVFINYNYCIKLQELIVLAMKINFWETAYECWGYVKFTVILWYALCFLKYQKTYQSEVSEKNRMLWGRDRPKELRRNYVLGDSTTRAALPTIPFEAQGENENICWVSELQVLCLVS